LTILGTAAPAFTATRVWIVDLDHTEKTAEFMATMKNSSGIEVYISGEVAPIEPEVGQQEENARGNVSLELAQKTIRTEYLDAYIVLPEGFTEGLAANGTTKVEVYYDSIDFLNRFIAETMITLGLTDVQMDNLLFESDVYAIPEIRPEEYNQFTEVDTLQIAAPEGLPLMLFFSIQMVVTQCIVGDKPLKRLLNTSLRRGEVVTGKILAYTILAIFQCILTLLLTQFFGVKIYGLWIDMFFVLLLNSICAITIGVFISTISKSRLQASQIFLLFFFVMYINLIYLRNDIFLRFTPLEQCKNGYLTIASRGMPMMAALPAVLNMLMTIAFFYLITIIYMKYFKKEFV